MNRNVFSDPSPTSMATEKFAFNSSIPAENDSERTNTRLRLFVDVKKAKDWSVSTERNNIIFCFQTCRGESDPGSDR